MTFNRCTKIPVFEGLVGLILLHGLPLIAQTNPPRAENPKDLVHQLNSAFETVFDQVAPAVAVIDVSKSNKPGATNNPFDGFDFFFHGPRDDQGDQPEQSEGSGVIVRADGYILTNDHVIGGADKIRIKLKDGRSFVGKVIGEDDRTDLAVIKVEAQGLPTATFADSDGVRVGELVCAIGAPYKFDYTFTTGVVSAKGRNDLLADKFEDYIQTDAAINPGNSGGPLCDVDGNVIGINTLIHGLNRGLGFAISSNMAKQVSDQLISSGRIVRPWLGIMIETLDDQNRGEVFKGVEKGVIVQTIRADTPAAKSDLRPADVITEIDGAPVANARDLQREILKKRIGQQVLLKVWRNGKRIDISMKTEELPSDNNVVAVQGGTPLPSDGGAAASYGLQVENITPRLKQELTLKSEVGVVVTQVAPDSPAAAADIQNGDVITEVGRTSVTDVGSFQKALQDQSGKPTLLLLLDRKGVKTYSIVKLGK